MATMKAVVCAKYGSADVLRIAEVAKPVPKANELLVRVRESIVTPSDVASRRGRPLLIRSFTGLLKPKHALGSDFAGEVEEVGGEVTLFSKGDRVFGAMSPASAANAEYVCVAETGTVAPLPQSMSYAASAGMCDAAMTALTFLRDKAGITRGQRVLINGASGAVGTFAIQLAKYYGTTVTAVCSGAHFSLVTSLGADATVDYTREDFTHKNERHDIIFDAVGKRSFSECNKALMPTGVYLTTVPSLAVIGAMLRTAKSNKKRAVFAATWLQQSKEKLLFLRDLIERGAVTSVVDRRYPLDQIASAHRYVETGHKAGNVILELP